MMVAVFIIGLAVGSFLNAYIFRLRESTMTKDSPSGAKRTVLGQSVWRGRSYCPKCKKHLRWYELIPLVSFVLQWGRCRGCKQRIDWQYPAVELATAIMFVANYELGIRNYGMIPDSLFLIRQVVGWYLLAVLITLFVYDLRYGLVPDRIILPAIVAALVYNVIASVAGSHAEGRSASGGQSPEIATASGLAMTSRWVLATAVGAAFFAVQYTISRGRWIGVGDIRLGALMGAVAGWPYVIVALVISYILGGLVSVALLAAGRKKFGQTVPLGTFLTVGTAITMLYGQDIATWYMRLL